MSMLPPGFTILLKAAIPARRRMHPKHSTQLHTYYSQISSSPDSQFGNGGFFNNSLYMMVILFLKIIAFLTTSSFRQSNKGRLSGIDISRPKP